MCEQGKQLGSCTREDLGGVAPHSTRTQETLPTRTCTSHSSPLPAERLVAVVAGAGDKRLRNNFLRSMKTVFANQGERRSVTEGFVVAHLYTEEENSIDEEIFLHLAHMSWSPYRPTFHRLERANTEQHPWMSLQFLNLKARPG